MTIVDNNVLSALAKVERLELLPTVFDDVGTTSSVVSELERARTAGYDFVTRIDDVASYDGGWLTVHAATEPELALARDVRDHALSTTDARCIAVAEHRDRRLVSDDAHVQTVASERDVPVWDLPLVLQAAVRCDAIATAAECSDLLEALARRDGYRLSSEDETALFDEFHSKQDDSNDRDRS